MDKVKTPISIIEKVPPPRDENKTQGSPEIGELGIFVFFKAILDTMDHYAIDHLALWQLG